MRTTNPLPINNLLGTAKIAAASLIKRLERLREREADLWYEECKRLKIIKE